MDGVTGSDLAKRVSASMRWIGRPRDWLTGTLVPVSCLVLIGLMVMPEIWPLHFALAVGRWASLQGINVTLDYRNDALSHLFLFLGLVVCVAVVTNMGTIASLQRRHLMLVVLGAVLYVQLTLIRDLVLFYVLWQVLGLLLAGALLDRGKASSALAVFWISDATGLALLIGSVFLMVSSGVPDLAGVLPEAARGPFLLLIVLAAVGRAGLFPLLVWVSTVSDRGKPYAGAFASICGVLAIVLVTRNLGLLPAMPLGARNLVIDYLALAVLVSSVLAYRRTQPTRSLVHVVTADTGVILLGALTGSPAALVGALLLLVSDSLGIAALLLAGVRAAGCRFAFAGSRSYRSAAILAGGSLIGVPPLLGFVARWLIIAALWDIGLSVIVVVIVIATIPRALALLRILQWTWAGAETVQLASVRGPRLLAALLAIFCLLPWLPLRYLVLPAVEAVKPVGMLTSTMTGGIGILGAIVAATTLTAACILALSYNADTRRVLGPATRSLASSFPLLTIWRAAGFFSHALAVFLFEMSDLGLSAGRSGFDRYAHRLVRLTQLFLQSCEERYFLVVTVFLATAIVLVFSG